MLRCNRGGLCDRSVCILHAEQHSRVPIALEELRLEYELKSVNVGQGEQKRPEFLERKLNGKVPVLIQTNGLRGEPFRLAESAAILAYLAERMGRSIPRVSKQALAYSSSSSSVFQESDRLSTKWAF